MEGLALPPQAPSSRHSHAGAVRSRTYVDQLSGCAQEEPVSSTRHFAVEGLALGPRRPNLGIPCQGSHLEHLGGVCMTVVRPCNVIGMLTLERPIPASAIPSPGLRVFTIYQHILE